MTSVNIPEGVTSIGDYAFHSCYGLTEVNIPEGVTSIGRSTFSGCNSLTSIVIPNSVTSIGDYAFAYSPGLTSIEIGNSVTSIGVMAFDSCSDLTRVNITDVEAWCKIDFGNSYSNPLFYAKNLFLNGELLTNLEIPEGINEIKKYAFFSYEGLTEVNIPEGVTSIGKYAFGNCRGLKGKLELPSSITSIDDNAFYCTNYKVCKIDATVPPTISSNSSLSSIFLVLVPTNSVDAYKADEQWSEYTIIAEGACDIEVTNETAGELSRSILTQTRKSLNNITSLTVHGTLNSDDIEKINSNMTSLLYLDINDTDITELPVSSFKNKKTLLSVKLPDELMSIGDSAFYGTSLSEELVLPEALETIGECAFQNCTMINGVLKIPACITSIGNYAFCGCNSIEFIKFNKALKSIGNNTFYNCTALDNVEFPASLETIGSSSFENCSGIKSLSFEGCTALKSISSSAFENCSGITALSFDGCESLISLGSFVFSGCTSLKEVDVLGCSSLLVTGKYMFSGCTSLQAVKLPSSLTTISSYVFRNCKGMEVMNLESCKNLSNINNTAFSGCTGLKLIDMTECTSLKTINSNTFSECSSLEIVNFPSSLIEIGASAFANCTKLQHMSVPCSTPPAIANNADPFSGVDNVACALSIPTENFFDYYDANYWGGFVDVESKSDIQIEVANPEDESNPSNSASIKYQFGCMIQYSKHHVNNPNPLNNLKTPLADEMVEMVDDINKAFTAGGQSVFVGNGDAVTFYFTPEEGKEIEKVLFNGVDVTSELVNNTYTTSAVIAMSSLKVILKQGSINNVEEIEVNDAAKTEYYNLQGVRVVNPGKGLYIKRVGDKTTKVVL